MTDTPNHAPLVTVYIPTRNRAPLLSRAIESVLQQTYPRLELIVVDDGSTDGTAQVVQAVQQQAGSDREVVYLHNPVSRGAPAARNQAIFRARGEYITGLDDDDEFLPDRVEYLLRHMSDDNSFLSTCVVEQGSDYRMPVRQPRQLIDGQRIRRKNFVGNQVFVRVDRLREVGGFDESLKAWQDYDLWLRLIDGFGPALKLPYCSYVLDRSEEVTRITTSSNAREGFEQFMAKHGQTMTSLQRKHQVINDLHNRTVRIGLREFFRLLERDTAVRLVALLFKAYWPGMYRLLVQIHMRLTGSAAGAG